MSSPRSGERVAPASPPSLMRRPRGVLFDLGGTLLQLETFDVEAGTEHVLSLADNPHRVSAKTVCEQLEELEVDLRARRDASWLEMSPFTVHRLIYEPLGVSFVRPFEEIELEFWQAATRFTPTEGIEDLLTELEARALPLGVVSNSTFTSRPLAWQLEQAGLLGFFRFVMSSGDYVVRKPHPTIFLTAARKLGTEPADTWYVGDHVEFDVAGAASAGMVPILYAPQAALVAHVADLEVARWSELSARLRAL
jgi:HAD superfamily hydrolase (TIGR01549 family)